MYRYKKSQLLDFIIPLILLIGAMSVAHEGPLDERLAGHFYHQTHSWIYRDNFLLEKILHKGGVIFIIIIFSCLIGWLIGIWRKPEKKFLKDYLLFVLMASLLTIVTVFFLKRFTTLPCPWNSVSFGGGTPTPSLWRMFSFDLPRGHCFPAGHSSAGFAFLSLYFAHTFIYGKRKLSLVCPGLVFGIVFGVAQQIRGAHFLSHDLATILLSISSSWITSWFFCYYNKNNEV